MRWRYLAAACVAAAILAGCTTPSPRPTPPPAPVAQPQPVASVPAPVASTPTPAQTPPSNLWGRLRARFAMDDCVPPAVHRAHRDTRNKRAFEQHMQSLMPIIGYVDKVAATNHVAGEFVLLPWVESHFREVRPRHHHAAGMWQIMPITARALHLPVTRRYDARLDKIASTAAAMRLLTRYYKKWHDWRLADMAYNTGEYRMLRILKHHGLPPADPVIPDLPVGHITRHHLIKLLAIACVIRDPQRFHIQLPKPDPAHHLEVVTLPAPARLRDVAKLAGVSLHTLRRLDAGYRLTSVPPGSPMQLLLPAQAATSLREAIAAGTLDTRALADVAPIGTYTVASGDSLWGIAHRFHLSVHELKHWNDLDGTLLHPGQVLRLLPPAG